MLLYIAAPKIECVSNKVEGNVMDTVNLECTLTANAEVTGIQWVSFSEGHTVGANEIKEKIGLASKVSFSWQ